MRALTVWERKERERSCRVKSEYVSMQTSTLLPSASSIATPKISGASRRWTRRRSCSRRSALLHSRCESRRARAATFRAGAGARTSGANLAHLSASRPHARGR